MLGLTAASTRVVTDRSYSRYSRSTSDEIDTTASGCSSREHVAHRALVRRVGVRVQEADADRADPAVAEELRRARVRTSSSNGRISDPSTASRPPTVLTRSAGTMRGGFTQKYELP